MNAKQDLESFPVGAVVYVLPKYYDLLVDYLSMLV